MEALSQLWWCDGRWEASGRASSTSSARGSSVELRPAPPPLSTEIFLHDMFVKSTD